LSSSSADLSSADSRRRGHKATLRRYIEPIGWIAMVLLLAGIGWLIWRTQAGA